MRNVFLLITVSILCFTFTHSQDKNMDNPFFKEWKTPFQTPPFDDITIEHYLPAFEEGMKLQKGEVDEIINNTDKPTFENTIEAMEKSGKLLTKVSSVFYNLNSANTNDEMQKIAKIVAPMLSKHNDDINLNEKLFARIKVIYNDKDKLKLSTEQNKVLKDYYDGFIRGGANLINDQKEKFRKINEELSVLSLRFGENLLKETNAVGLVIENTEDLAGLPESVIQSAFELGKAKGYDGKWVFTLQKPSFIPFLQYSHSP